MKLLLNAAFWGILIVSTCAAQFQPAIFAIRPAEMEFLRYNYYYNAFDSCAVYANIGEFSVETQGQRQYVPLLHYKDYEDYQGDTVQGADWRLAERSRSQSFSVTTPQCTLRFYRWIAITATPTGTGNFRNAYPSPNSYDEYWNIGTGKVPEQTEFRIEVIRAADGQRVALIDSVGVLPNPLLPVAARYGTDADILYNQRTLSLPVNTNLQFRIVPARYGPTPYGLGMNQFPQGYNSSYGERNKNGKWNFMTAAEFDTLNKHHWEAACAYTDSVIAVTGRLPSPMITEMPTGYERAYVQRYFDSVGVNNAGYGRYEAKNFPQPLAKSGSETKSENGTSGFLPSISIRQLRPLPVSGGMLTVEIRNTTGNTRQLRMEVVDINGNSAKVQAWKGSVASGSMNIEFDTTPCSNGTYFVALHSESGELLAKRSFVVAR